MGVPEIGIKNWNSQPREASNRKSEEEKQQRATQQLTINKAGNGKGSKGEVSYAQKERGGAAVLEATTNQQLSRDQQRLQGGGKQQQS